MPATFDEDDGITTPEASIAALTGAIGTADGAMEDVTATPTQAAVNNNFRELQTKVNAILVALRAANIIAED